MKSIVFGVISLFLLVCAPIMAQGIRRNTTVQYKLAPREAGWVLKLDRVVEY